MTARAIGAAVVPPTPLWFCSTTATATSGGDVSSLPAKAMNHVVFDELIEYRRVKVLRVASVTVSKKT